MATGSPDVETTYFVNCNLCTERMTVTGIRTSKGKFSLDLSEFKFHMITEHKVDYRRDRDKHPQPVR